jgi:hypothetical protein
VPVNPTLGSLGQENREFEVRLGNIERFCLIKKNVFRGNII